MVKDKFARDRFIEENLGLVHSLCRRFSGRGIEYDDLFQAGCLGLIKATDAFDDTRGLCFSTYAVPVILGEIKRLFRDGGAVKISRSLKELSLKVTRAKEQMALKLGREPTVSELAGELDTDPELIAEAICAARPVISLTADSDDGISQYDLPVSGPEEELSDRLLISSIFDMLDERDRKIMDCRYFRGLTQSRTAALLGMTQVQVSRAERRILKRLKEILEE